MTDTYYPNTNPYKNDDVMISNETHSITAANIDIDMVNKSLARVNPFQANKRKSVFLEKQHASTNQTLLVLQISSLKTSDDDSIYLNLTLRELLNVVLVSANHNDEVFFEEKHHRGVEDVLNQTDTNIPAFDTSPAFDAKKASRHASYHVPSNVRPVNISSSNHSRNPSITASSMSRNPSFTEGRFNSGERVLSGDRVPSNHFLSNPHTHLSTPVAMVDEAGRDIGFNAVNILRLRDLRRLDFLFNPVDEANVIVRRHVVLLSFDPIRALIMADKLLLIVPDGADSLLQILKQYMAEWKDRNQSEADNHHIPFESHAYEALLTTVTSIQTQEFDILKKDVDDALSYFKSGAILPVDKQEKMRYLKNAVNATKSRVIGHKRVLLDLMDDDEVMALMNLSKLKDNPNLYLSPLVPEILVCHEDIEELLETFLMDYNSLESKLEHLRVQIQSAEELVSLRLDTSRNELLVANTAMAVLAVCIGFNSYIAGIFGMNLDNVDVIQPVPGIFFTVFAVTMVLIFVSFYLIILYYTETGVLPKRVRKRVKNN